MIRLQRFNFIFYAVSFSILLLVASFFKVSFIFGSKMAFFSGVEILSPLSGALGGMSFAIPLLLCRSFVNQVNPFLFLIRHIPGLFGAWYWASHSPIVRLFTPLACMALFLVHPVGAQAYAYSFFWVIPVMLYMLNFQGAFAQALGSTFVVHAVGSIIWLYTVPMTAIQWWSLIPVVIIERLVFAGIQTGVFQLYKQGIILLNQYNLYHTIRKQLVRTFSL